MKTRFPFLRILFLVMSASAALGQAPAPAAPLPDARAAEIGRAFQRYQDQLRAIHASTPELNPWWRAPVGSNSVPGLREKVAEAQREFHAAVRDLLGAEPIGPTGRDSRYSFLPEAKQVLVAQIEQSYAERAGDLRREAPNVRLPADTEKMKQLSATRDRELAAVLTLDERERLELRTSQSSFTIRQRFAEVVETEEEFRKVYLLQKTFDEKFPIEDAVYSSRQQEMMRLRSEGERKLMDEIRDAVGEERFVAYRRAMDQDFQSIRAIVRRLALPEDTVEKAMKTRDHYSAQSLAINGETSLNHNDRRALLQDLGKEARKELASVLTLAGAEAYTARAQWVRYLEQGSAFSTNPKDSASTFSSVTQSTYMVLPGGATMSSGASSPGTITTAPAGASATPQRRPRPAPAPGAPAEKGAPAAPAPPATPLPAPKS